MAPESELVMAVTGESRWEVVEALAQMERAGFTHEGVSVLGPYADPVRAALPRETYRAIHRSIAEALAAAAAPAAPVPNTVTYRITGTKSLLDLVTVIYTDGQGALQTDVNVALPWAKTVTLNPGVTLSSVTATSVTDIAEPKAQLRDCRNRSTSKNHPSDL